MLSIIPLEALLGFSDALDTSCKEKYKISLNKAQILPDTVQSMGLDVEIMSMVPREGAW